jgi:hypothetical protein
LHVAEPQGTPQTSAHTPPGSILWRGSIFS